MRRFWRKEARSPVTVELECLECHSHARVDLSAEQFKSMSQSWKVAQDCQACGKATDWSFAEAAVADNEQVDFWDWLATTGEYFEPSPAGVEDERRKEPRLNVRIDLRIATADGEEEEVTSENISMTGLCFLSRKTYRPGDSVRVTLKPPGAAAPQRLSATIVRAVAAGEGKTLYGARIGAGSPAQA